MKKILFLLFICCSVFVFAEIKIGDGKGNVYTLSKAIDMQNEADLPVFGAELIKSISNSSGLNENQRLDIITEASCELINSTTSLSNSIKIIYEILKVMPEKYLPEYTSEFYFKKDVKEYYSIIPDCDYSNSVIRTMMKHIDKGITTDKEVKEKRYDLYFYAYRLLGRNPVPMKSDKKVVYPVNINDILRLGQEDLDDNSNVTRVGRPVPVTYRDRTKNTSKKYHSSHSKNKKIPPTPTPYSGQF